MRILIVGQNLLSPYSGPSSVVRNLLNGFIKNIDLINKKDVKLTFLSLNENVGIIKINDNIQLMGLAIAKPITLTLELQSLLIRVGNFDLVHTHVLQFIPKFALKGIPTIYTLHGILWKEIHYYRGIYQKIWQSLLMCRFKTYMPLLTKLVAISPYVIEELKEYKVNILPNKVVLIENPVSDFYFNLIKKEDYIILYPAVFIPRKNQLNFLKALELIKNEVKEYKIIFTIGGYFDKNYLTYAKYYVSKKNLKNVEFLKCPLKDMLNLYSRASFVILLSLQETLPMSILEAMATGTPVLASKIKPMKYVIDDGVTGLLADPIDVKDIAEKVLLLINDVNLRKKLGLNAKLIAEKRWRSEVIAKEHLKMYEEIIHRTRK